MEADVEDLGLSVPWAITQGETVEAVFFIQVLLLMAKKMMIVMPNMNLAKYDPSTSALGPQSPSRDGDVLPAL